MPITTSASTEMLGNTADSSLMVWSMNILGCQWAFAVALEFSQECLKLLLTG